MEHLLLCVALLTGIALVSLDLSSMQFPKVGFHRSRLAFFFIYLFHSVCTTRVSPVGIPRDIYRICFYINVLCMSMCTIVSFPFNPLAYTDVPETAGLARSINP